MYIYIDFHHQIIINILFGLEVQPVTLDVGARLREPWQLRHVVLVLLGTLGHGKRLSLLSGANGVRQVGT